MLLSGAAPRGTSPLIDSDYYYHYHHRHCYCRKIPIFGHGPPDQAGYLTSNVVKKYHGGKKDIKSRMGQTGPRMENS